LHVFRDLDFVNFVGEAVLISRVSWLWAEEERSRDWGREEGVYPSSSSVMEILMPLGVWVV